MVVLPLIIDPGKIFVPAPIFTEGSIIIPSVQINLTPSAQSFLNTAVLAAALRVKSSSAEPARILSSGFPVTKVPATVPLPEITLSAAGIKPLPSLSSGSALLKSSDRNAPFTQNALFVSSLIKAVLPPEARTVIS